MNLMVVLIPMLLAVSQFVQISRLDYQPPPAENIAELEADGNGEERLDLVVNVLESGFEVSLFGETAGRNYKKINFKDGEYNFNRLSSELIRIKKDIVGAPIDSLIKIDDVSGLKYYEIHYKYVDGEAVSIAAKGNTDWQLIVRVMDICREYKDESGGTVNLFPQSRLGQIQ